VNVVRKEVASELKLCQMESSKKVDEHARGRRASAKEYSQQKQCYKECEYAMLIG